jgi:ketosteroid isomerase-like protein
MAVVVTLALISALAPRCLQAQAGEADLSRLRAADSSWQAASVARDVERMTAHYAPGATADFGGRPARGREAIRQYWETAYKDSLYRLSWVNSRAELMSGTDLAYTLGRWRLVQKAGEQTGTYFAVWRRQPDGSWLVLIDTAR